MSKVTKFDNSELIKLLENNDFIVELDADGDIYVSDNGLEVACWLNYNSDADLLRVSTFTKFKKEVNIENALEFSNMANSSVFYPGYSVANGTNGHFLFWGFYFIDTTFGVEIDFLINSIRRFS